MAIRFKLVTYLLIWKRCDPQKDYKKSVMAGLKDLVFWNWVILETANVYQGSLFNREPCVYLLKHHLN